MRLRFLVSIAGMDVSYAAGQEIDVPDDEGRRWLQSGIHAERIDTPADEPTVAPRKRKS